MKQRETKTHKIAYHLTRTVIRPVMKHKYSFTTDSVPDTGEPFLLLSNHTTEDDMLLAGIAAKKHMYFVCGEHLLRNKLYGRPLRLLFDPVPVPKGGASLEAVREMIRRLRAGQNVCMFPEGKRSFHGETIPSSAALGKLVKKSGCALVTYRIRGGYFTYPRWARKHHRKGHVEGKVMGVYSSSQLSGMTAQQITEIINRDTYENAYEVQRGKLWRYTGKDRAKGLEHILFMCPKCRGMDTIKTDGDELCCTACGLKAVYNDYGFFEGEELPFDNVHSWMRWIEPEFDRYVMENSTAGSELRETISQDSKSSDEAENDSVFCEASAYSGQPSDTMGNGGDRAVGDSKAAKDMKIPAEGDADNIQRIEKTLFTEENVRLYRMLDGYKNEDLLTGTLHIYRDKMAIGGREYRFSEIPQLSMLFGNIILFTYDRTYYGLRGESFRAWKCARLWHLAKGDTADRTREI